LSHLEDAQNRAVALNLEIDREADAHQLDEVNTFLTRIRSLLMSNEQEEVSNNIHILLKKTESREMVDIVLGPQIDKGPSEGHFKFDTGARLSFGITLRRERRKATLNSYRFHYVFPEGHSPAFIRFDLNARGDRPPLEESRCHLHPGLSKTRIPSRVLSPIEVLDRVFYVLDKCSCTLHSDGDL
jgi:hypothetical protein